MSSAIFKVSNCFNCPNYSHSGGFTPGGAIPLCGAVTSKRFKYNRKELPSTIDKVSGRRKATGDIPNWCPIKEREYPQKPEPKKEPKNMGDLKGISSQMDYLNEYMGDEKDAQSLREVASDQEDEANDERPIGELVDEYAELRSHLDSERKKFKELESQLKGDMELIEARILAKQKALGVKSISTENYTAFQTEKTFVRMGDWDTFSAWILETGNIQCLEKRCAKLACLEVEEVMNEGKDEGDDRFYLEDIGVNKTKELAVQIRKR